MPESPHMTRRDFVKTVTAVIGTLMGAVIGLPAIGYIITPARTTQEADAWIPLGSLESFPEGVPTLVNFVRTKVNGWERSANSYGVYVVRDPVNQVIAFSNICTHLGCRVSWQEASQEYICPCHDAAFDASGGIIKGPQPRPLDLYESKVEDGNLFIHFTEA